MANPMRWQPGAPDVTGVLYHVSDKGCVVRRCTVATSVTAWAAWPPHGAPIGYGATAEDAMRMLERRR